MTESDRYSSLAQLPKDKRLRALLSDKRHANIVDDWPYWIRNKSDIQALEEGCYVDLAYGEHACDFFKSILVLSKDRFAGEYFDLLLWEADVLNRGFSWRRKSGAMRFSEFEIWTPKKQGKSTFDGGLALYLTLANGESRNMVFIAATDKEQAKIAWGEAAALCRASPELEGLCNVIDSTQRIIQPESGSICRAISSDHHRQHGHDATAVICDEIHAWHGTAGRELWNTLCYAGIARSQPLIIVTSTAGLYDPECIGYKRYDYACKIRDGALIDTTVLPIIYGVPMDEDWEDETQWWRSNPALGWITRIEEMQKSYESAKYDLSTQNNFRRYRLNQWVSQETRWIDMEAWNACESEWSLDDVPDHYKCYAGLDLASTEDMSALVLLFMADLDSPIYLLPHFYMPDHNIRRREKEDQLPYQEWSAAGYLTLTPGITTDYEFIRKHLLDLEEQHHIGIVGYDPWQARYLVERLEKEDGLNMVEVRQGYGSMSDASKAFHSLITSGRLMHGGHPILREHANNVATRSDPNGNIMPDKSKARGRIDGIVASIIALRVAQASEQSGPSVYETAGAECL